MNYKLLWDGKVPSAWSQIVIDAVKEFGKDLLELDPTDKGEFNPRYDEIDKVYFWSQLVIAMAKKESSWNPKAKYTEAFADANGKRVVSRGLTQISIESSNQTRYCPNGVKIKDAQKLHEVQFNLEKTVMIMNYWCKKDNRIGGYKKGAGRYWSVMRGNKSSTRWIKAQITAMPFVKIEGDTTTIVHGSLPAKAIELISKVQEDIVELNKDLKDIKEGTYDFAGNYDLDHSDDNTGSDTIDNAAPVMQERIPFAIQNFGGYKYKERGEYKGGHPKGVVIHFNAGRGGNAKTEAEAQKHTKNLLSLLNRKGLGTITIDSFGNIYQNMSCLQWGYHAGVSSWPGLSGSVSDELLGIDVMGAGKLSEKNGKLYTWFGSVIPKENARYVEAKDNVKAGWYEKFTEEQEKALTKLLLWLHHNGDGKFSMDFVVGHDSVSPDRKNDPGGSFSMTVPEYQEYLKKLV